MRVLVEVHAHYTQQQAIAPLVDLIYDFQTAPLLLHSFFTGTVDKLDLWFQQRPNNCLNVLDTHDGYGVIDAGPINGKPGLITQDDMAFIFKKASENTEGHSDIASVVPQWFTLPHQINATLPNILANDTAYFISRAVQFVLPGEPQVYYVGLFNGMDDQELFRASGQGRDVNRHNYTPAEIEQALTQPVVQAIIALARLRKHNAFNGKFAWAIEGADRLSLGWDNGNDSVRLSFATTVGAPSFVIEVVTDGESQVFNTIEGFATFA
jgi:sucrose phosphorylase